MNRAAFGTSLLLCLLPVSFSLGADLPLPRRVSTAESVFAIYTTDLRLFSSEAPRLIVAAWPDGHIAWSEDRLRGGPPYRSGHFEARKLRDMMTRLENDGLFTKTALSKPRFGPDAPFTTILIVCGDKRIELTSWHELAELTGTTAATDSGLIPLNGRSRLSVLEEQPKEYLFFRSAWGELRTNAANLIPPTGSPVEGELTGGKSMSWRERAIVQPAKD